MKKKKNPHFKCLTSSRTKKYSFHNFTLNSEDSGVCINIILSDKNLDKSQDLTRLKREFSE